MVGLTSIYGRLIESYDHNNNDMHECILLKTFLVIRIELSENKQLPLNEFNLLIHILAVSLLIRIYCRQLCINVRSLQAHLPRVGYFDVAVFLYSVG